MLTNRPDPQEILGVVEEAAGTCMFEGCKEKGKENNGEDGKTSPRSNITLYRRNYTAP
jgi:hypothetical protein